MILYSLKNGEKAFGENVLFEDVTFSVYEKDKIGLIGANGTGKTTLLKAMLSQLPFDGGEVFINKDTKIGYLKQQISADSEKSIYEEVLTVFSSLLEIEAQLLDISLEIEEKRNDTDSLIRRQNALNERFEREGGFTYKNIVRSSLMGLGFSEQELLRPLSSLSGGQLTRVMLCKVLLSDANMLLLDEPTNHLDIEAIEWLEVFLKGYKGAVLVISHDRYFLDRITNKTFELSGSRITVYDGNYSFFMTQKAEREKTITRVYEKTTKEIERLEAIIKQQRRWNREKNIKTAESKQKIIDRLLDSLVEPESERETIKFGFTVSRSGPNDVAQACSLSFSFSHKPLLRDVNFNLYRGERVFLLGPNGCGKTTFFKLLLGELQPASGYVKISDGVEVGYYDQTQQSLNPDNTVFDEIYDSFPKLTAAEIRNALAAFLFKNDEVFKPVSSLSGGEKARVTLTKLMLLNANLLILDEPTNHLDIESKEALEQALSEYLGTMLVISHDRYFINKLAERICCLDKSGFKSYSGNYDYFLEKHKPADEDGELVQKPRVNDYKLEKQKQAQIRIKENKLKKTEDKIEETEKRIEELREKQSEFATDYIKAMEIENETAQLSSELEQLYIQWEQLSEQTLLT